MAQQNRDLLNQIESLSKQKNYPVNTEGLNNQQLQSLLAELQNAPTTTTTAGATRRASSSGGDPRLPEGGGTEATAVVTTVGDRQPNGGIVANAAVDVQRAQREGRDPQTEQRQFQYAVAKGRSLTSPRGVLDAGAEVRPEDVGGQERLNVLLQRGIIVSGSGSEGGGGSTTRVATVGEPGAPSARPTDENVKP